MFYILWNKHYTNTAFSRNYCFGIILLCLENCCSHAAVLIRTVCEESSVEYLSKMLIGFF